jgi:hypothetical protein
MAKRAVKLRGRSIAALVLAGFVLTAVGVISRRTYGTAQQKEIGQLKQRLDGLIAERESIESAIRTASSRPVLAPLAEQRLKLFVATGSQLVTLPHRSPRDTP